MSNPKSGAGEREPSEEQSSQSRKHRILDSITSSRGIIASIGVILALSVGGTNLYSWIEDRLGDIPSSRDVAVVSQVVPEANIREVGVDYALRYGVTLPIIEGDHGYCTRSDSEALKATGVRLRDVVRVAIENKYRGSRGGSVLLTNFRAEIVEEIPPLSGVRFHCPTGGLLERTILEIDLDKSLAASLATDEYVEPIENFAPGISLTPGEVGDFYVDIRTESQGYRVHLVADVIAEGQTSKLYLTASPVTIHSASALSKVWLMPSTKESLDGTNILTCRVGDEGADCPMRSVFTHDEEGGLADGILER